MGAIDVDRLVRNGWLHRSGFPRMMNDEKELPVKKGSYLSIFRTSLNEMNFSEPIIPAMWSLR